jgi:hypothetical protein
MKYLFFYIAVKKAAIVSHQPTLDVRRRNTGIIYDDNFILCLTRRLPKGEKEVFFDEQHDK